MSSSVFAKPSKELVPYSDEQEASSESDERSNGKLTEILKKISLFRDLPEAVYKQLYENSDSRDYEGGHTVFSLGQYDGSEFFVLASGAMRITAIDPQSGAMHVEELQAPTIFGLDAILTERPVEEFQQLAVTADTDITLIAIDAAAFRELTVNRPTLMRSVAQYLANMLVSLRYSLKEVIANPEQRICKALLDLIERTPDQKKWQIAKMPKHRDLAEMADVDEVETAEVVATLIKEGVAKREYPGLLIEDIGKLRHLAG